MEDIIAKLTRIKEDVDAIYHHQTDRIVTEIASVIEELKDRNIETATVFNPKTEAN